MPLVSTSLSFYTSILNIVGWIPTIRIDDDDDDDEVKGVSITNPGIPAMPTLPFMSWGLGRTAEPGDRRPWKQGLC